METIKELQVEFTRKGWHYLQIGRNDERYLYQVTTTENHVFYEVFKRKLGKTFDRTGLYVQYPGNEDFGVWAKCVNCLEKAKYYLDNGFAKRP